MENGAKYSGFPRVSAVRESAATACQCSPTLQWTTSSYRAPETAWSLSPFIYTPSNQPCLCLRYRKMECGPSKIKTSTSLCPNEPAKEQNESISKNLKFGIERILTQSCKEDTNSDLPNKVKECNAKSAHESSSTGGKIQRKNGTRSVFSHVQRNILELHYQQREYVTKGERYHIAMAAGISEEQVKIWFQNRRTKKKKLERNKMVAAEKNKSEHCSLNIMDFH